MSRKYPSTNAVVHRSLHQKDCHKSYCHTASDRAQMDHAVIVIDYALAIFLEDESCGIKCVWGIIYMIEPLKRIKHCKYSKNV